MPKLKRRKMPSKKWLKYERKFKRIANIELKSFLEKIDQVVTPRLAMLIESQNFQETYTQDGREDYNIQQLIDLAYSQYLGAYSEAEVRQYLGDIYAEMGTELNQAVLNQLATETLSVWSPKDSVAVKSAVDRGVEYLADIPREARNQMKNKISQGISQGKRWEDIAKDITSNTTGSAKNTAENRAKFIARNEVNSALGEINKESQTSVGIQLYTWQTANDERVRHTHADLQDGSPYSWSGTVVIDGVKYEEAFDEEFNGGQFTSPGLPYNCRCIAIPFEAD